MSDALDLRQHLGRDRSEPGRPLVEAPESDCLYYMLYTTILYYTILYHTVLYYPIQYYNLGKVCNDRVARHISRVAPDPVDLVRTRGSDQTLVPHFQNPNPEGGRTGGPHDFGLQCFMRESQTQKSGICSTTLMTLTHFIFSATEL